MKVSYESIGQQIVTFKSAAGTKAGDVCAMSANNTVANIAVTDTDFIGYVSDVSGDNAAAVVLHGYVQMPYTGSSAPTIGWCGLASDGAGAVKAVTTAKSYLVTDVNTTDATVGFFM